MRPKDRLLRRDIPKEAIRKALEDWSDRLSSWDEFFTATVVFGLMIEYLPEIGRFLPAGGVADAMGTLPNPEEPRLEVVISEKGAIRFRPISDTSGQQPQA